MASGIIDLIHLMERHFNNGAANRLAVLFVQRLPIYSPAGLSLNASQVDTEVAVEKLLADAKAAGVVRTTAHQLSLEPGPQADTGTIRVRWDYLDSSGTVIASSDIKYFCGPDEDGEMRILMVEYIEAGFPTVLSQVPPAIEPPKPH